MYELVQAGKNTFYIDCPAKIGVWRESETDVWLIDAGNDKDAGRKILKILKAQGWTLKGILNTHSNADHVGGNRYLQEQTGCKIFASGVEAAIIQPYPAGTDTDLGRISLWRPAPQVSARAGERRAVSERPSLSQDDRNHPPAGALSGYGRLPHAGRRGIPGRLCDE